MKVKFQEVSLRATKSGKCRCGKYLRRSKTFTNTINPFNKNNDGLPKSYNEVYADVERLVEDWQSRPPEHDHQGYWNWSKEQQKEYDEKGKTTVPMSCGEMTEIVKP